MTVPLACSKKEQDISKIDYSTQVKPIINKHCIACHGGVKRQADFSLLFRQDALDTTESGKPVIIPGDAHSELIRRISSDDPEERMPYKEEALSAEEITILSDWIKQGAPWGDHWAYVAPKKVEVPKPRTLLSGFWFEDSWPENDIDYFIQEKQLALALKPSPEVDKPTLIRRASLDLVGLPPTEKQVKKFLEDESEEAYEKLINELMASPEFGEKWASWWLDMARYSDTRGYEKDASRNIWRYRDWVIKALNEDKPFDQFTIEQLAGDLLPNPTDDQRIATGFHRNTMNNDEGGTLDEEYRVAAVIDRVNTSWAVWQSTTMGCVQCHSHPYDPFRHEEYYKSLAFFNNTRDEDTPGEHPTLRIYKQEDQVKLNDIKAWVRKYSTPEKDIEITNFLRTLEPKIHAHNCDQFINGALVDTKFLGIRHGGSVRLKATNLDNKTNILFHYWMSKPGGSIEIRRDKLEGEAIARVRLDTTGRNQMTIAVPLKQTSGKHDLYFVFYNSKLKPDESVCGVEWFTFRDDLPGKDRPDFKIVEEEFYQVLNARVEDTPVMVESDQDLFRETRIFERGNWMMRGDLVTPDVPKSLNPLGKDMPRNRLGFARWLVAKDNPLTGRTVVNQVWEQIFGNGIVETLEDFGTQGALPSHPELLDWLALRFTIDHQWSLKKLIRDVMLSATYRQDSRVTKELLENDLSNKWLTRGPRIRLSAEQVRDQALAVSGLLSKKMYGRPVMPFQPEGVWQVVYNDDRWETSKGEDRYRRGIYTFQKRTSPYPSMISFDGSSREVCTIRRIRTNTPLQALVTLNDPVYMDAARALASKMMKAGNTTEERISSGYQAALFHSISERKLAVLTTLYNDAVDQYKKDNKAAQHLLKTENAQPEAAAMTIVANAILNLDEFITKE
ncbi:MAG: DUF1553 domain-containing protein [Bacteroidota bacterium]